MGGWMGGFSHVYYGVIGSHVRMCVYLCLTHCLSCPDIGFIVRLIYIKKKYYIKVRHVSCYQIVLQSPSDCI